MANSSFLSRPQAMGQPGLYTIQLVLAFADGRPGMRKQAEQAASLPALGLTHSRAGAPRAGPDVTRGSTSKTTETTTLASRTGWGCCGLKAQDAGGGAQAAAGTGRNSPRFPTRAPSSCCLKALPPQNGLWDAGGHEAQKRRHYANTRDQTC